MLRADSVSADEHALDEVVGVGLDYRSVHERAGIALVGVTDEVFLVARALTCGVPLEPCRETCAASARETRGLDDLDDFFGAELAESLFQSGITARVCVGVDLLGVDNAAIAQRDSCLLGEEFAVLLGNNEVFDSLYVAALNEGSDSGSVVFADLYEPCEVVVIVVDVNDGLEVAHADTARDGHVGGIYVGG